MADQGKKDEHAEGGKAKKGLPMKLILFGGIGLVVLLLVLGGAYFFLFSGSSEKTEGAGGEHAEGPKKEETHKAEAFYLDLPELVVNLTSTETRAAFVKVGVSLQVSDKAMIEQITVHLPKVLDAFQLYLREMRIADLQGSAGMFRLKEELQRRLNLLVYPAKVDDVLFRSILVQ